MRRSRSLLLVQVRAAAQAFLEPQASQVSPRAHGYLSVYLQDTDCLRALSPTDLGSVFFVMGPLYVSVAATAQPTVSHGSRFARDHGRFWSHWPHRCAIIMLRAISPGTLQTVWLDLHMQCYATWHVSCLK